MESSQPKRRFPPPWPVKKIDGGYVVTDSNGVVLATIQCIEDAHRLRFSHKHLTDDEARRIAKAIGRLPEFLMQRQGFYSRDGGHSRWRKDRPYHVALEDHYVRAHWFGIDALCKLNSIPFNATGEKIQDGATWCVYEFTWQMDAIQFWDRFNGRWLRGSEFHYPERPKDLLPMKELRGFPEFDPKKARG